MSLRERALSGLLWSSIEKWGSKVFTFGVFLLLARLLEPSAFGLVALATVYIDLAQVLVDQGLTRALVQRKELQDAHLHTAFWSSLGVSAVLTALTVVLAGPMTRLLGHQELAPIIIALSVTFLLSAFRGVHLALLQRELAFRAISLRTLAARAVAASVGVGLAVADYGVWSLVGQEVTAHAVGALLLSGVGGYRPRLSFSMSHFRELFGFGAHVMATDVLDFFNRRADDFLIGVFLGPQALGYYVIAYRVLLVLTQLLTSVSSSVALPVFSRLQDQPERLERAFLAAIRYTSLLAFPVFFGLLAVAPDLLPAAFGESWRPSIPVMRALAPVGAIHAVLYFNSTMILALGRPGVRLALNAASAVVNVLAFFVVVRYGIVAVAVAYLISNCVLAPINVWALRALFPMRIRGYLGRLALPLVASVAMVSAIALLAHVWGGEGSSSTRAGGQILAGALVYCSLVLAWDAELRENVSRLAGLLRSRVRRAT